VRVQVTPLRQRMIDGVAIRNIVAVDQEALCSRGRELQSRFSTIASKHGRFTRDAIAGRKQIEALLREVRKLLREMK